MNIEICLLKYIKVFVLSEVKTGMICRAKIATGGFSPA
jgi:hypothetical protein